MDFADCNHLLRRTITHMPEPIVFSCCLLKCVQSKVTLEPVQSRKKVMASLVNVQEYQSLCSMSFKDIAAMTAQLTALDGSDNFNYIMALQDICSRLSQKKANLFSRAKTRPFSRRKIKKKTTVIKEHTYWWDLLGLFTHETEETIEKSDLNDDNEQSFISYLLDPFGLFKADKAEIEEKIDKKSQDSEFYDDYYYHDYVSGEMNRRLGIDSSEVLKPYLQSLAQDYYDYADQTPSASEKQDNKRLAFVHYVYPRTNDDENSQHFQTFQD